MKMPQDFIDAINAAVHEVNPDARVVTSGSMSLGTAFNEWVGADALREYGLGPLPEEAIAAFNAKLEEKREELKASVVKSAVHIEQMRMAGKLVNQPPVSGQPKRNIRDVVEALKEGRIA